MSEINSENLETENGNNGNNDPNGAGAGANAGAGNVEPTDSADGRTIGSENGASGGTSGGGGADGGNGGNGGGTSDPNELGDDGRSESNSVGTLGTEQPVGDARSGGRRRRGRPAGSGGNRVAGSSTGTDRTTENTVGNLGSSDLNQGEPKKVKPSLLDESDTKLSKNEIVDIIGKTLQAIFFVPANFLGQDHWLLDNSEAKELAGAIWDVVKTLPAKQGKRIDKFLKENAPYLKLAIVSGTILWSKISISIEISNLQRENAKLKENQNGNGFTANKSNANASPNGNGFPRAASWSDVINAGRGG